MTRKHLLHLVIILVFVVQLQIICKVLRNLWKLQIFSHQFPVHLAALLFVDPDQFGQIFPATRRHKALAVHRRLNLTEILAAGRSDKKGWLDAPCSLCILFPDVQIRLHIDAADPVHGHDIELPHRLVVLRRVSCCHNDPSLRNLMVSKDLPCRNCSMVGASVSDTQLISSINRMPSGIPLCSMRS